MLKRSDREVKEILEEIIPGWLCLERAYVFSTARSVDIQPTKKTGTMDLTYNEPHQGVCVCGVH